MATEILQLAENKFNQLKKKIESVTRPIPGEEKQVIIEDILELLSVLSEHSGIPGISVLEFASNELKNRAERLSIIVEPLAGISSTVDFVQLLESKKPPVPEAVTFDKLTPDQVARAQRLYDAYITDPRHQHLESLMANQQLEAAMNALRALAEKILSYYSSSYEISKFSSSKTAFFVKKYSFVNTKIGFEDYIAEVLKRQSGKFIGSMSDPEDEQEAIEQSLDEQFNRSGMYGFYFQATYSNPHRGYIGDPFDHNLYLSFPKKDKMELIFEFSRYSTRNRTFTTVDELLHFIVDLITETGNTQNVLDKPFAPYHFSTYEREEWEKLVKSNGFKLLSTKLRSQGINSSNLSDLIYVHLNGIKDQTRAAVQLAQNEADLLDAVRTTAHNTGQTAYNTGRTVSNTSAINAINRNIIEGASQVSNQISSLAETLKTIHSR